MLLDTFPVFATFWKGARNFPFDEQIRGWEEMYLRAWPELAAMQMEDYQAQGVDWREVARDKVFPFLDERMRGMEAAHAILLELCEPVRQRAITAIGLSTNIIFVVHVGLGCGAGWATRFQDSPAILFGLESIAELGWNSRDVLTGLIAHEIGHLAHYQWRAQGKIPLEDGPWSQFYDEGIAQCCESLLLNTSILHQSFIGVEGDWLAWCTGHKGWLAAEFLRFVQANEPVSKFLGSWFEIQGRSETGYFLGQAVVETLMAKGCSLEGISQLDPEQAAKPILRISAGNELKLPYAVFPGCKFPTIQPLQPTGTLMTDTSQPIYRMTDLQETERPRERLASLGPQVLNNAELIAILLRVGVPGENAVQVGQRLLQTFGGLPGLHRAPFEELVDQHGIGNAKAAQIKAAIELGRRLRDEKPEERLTINSPSDAAELVKYEMSALEQEHLRVLLLDTRNHVLETVEVYKGSVNSSQVRVGEVFKPAIRRGASALIVVHNHPSGDPTPSPDDVAVTRAFVQAGKLLDVEVLDHLVIGLGRYVSLKERGLGFS